MRGWFITGCKLIGVYILCRSLISLVGAIGQTITFPMIRDKMVPADNSAVFFSLFSLLNAVLLVIFSFILLFRAEWLADKVKLQEDLQATGGHVGRPELRLGLVLIGIYIFITRAGGFFAAFLKDQIVHRLNFPRSPFAGTEPSGLAFSQDILKPLVPVVLSLLLVFASGPIARFLIKENTAENQPEAPD